MIKQLNQESISKIATSATIQSLTTFLKELIENSIDAKSTQIIINFFNHGKDGFEVIDNGIGITLQNQQLLATRGGTSKITQFDDLESVLTHGFRGEALNSIASLSNVTITSKHQDDEIGWKWEIPNPPSKLARTIGTTVRVENIFYTLPVRQQEFLKNYKTEYHKAVNLLTEYAIINTDIEFKVCNDEERGKRKIIMDCGNNLNNKRQRIANVLGEGLAQDLIEFTKVEQDFTLRGFLSKSIESGSYKGQTRKTFWYCYINKKPINAPKTVLQIMRDIYRQHNPNGNFFYILEIELNDISDADFNVSVDKRDVYLKGEKQIYESLQTIVEETIEKNKEKLKFIGRDGNLDQFIVSKKQVQTQPEETVKRRESAPLQEIQKKNSSFLSQLKNLNKQSTHPEQSTLKTNQHQIIKEQKSTQPIDQIIEQEIETNFDKKNFRNLKIIGQFNQGFILCHLDQRIYVLDQHACDEKFNYEKLTEQLKFSRVPLIIPISLKLSGYQVELIQDHQNEINEKFKYQIEILGNEIKLKTCPSFSNIQFGQEAFLKIIDQLSQGKNIDQVEMPQIKQKLASQACRSSIMIGVDLDRQQMEKVVQNLAELQSPWNCPHGRPTLIQVQQPKTIKLEKGFGMKLLL